MLFSHIKKKNINTKNRIPPKLWYCDSGWPTVQSKIGQRILNSNLLVHLNPNFRESGLHTYIQLNFLLLVMGGWGIFVGLILLQIDIILPRSSREASPYKGNSYKSIRKFYILVQTWLRTKCHVKNSKWWQ